MMERTPLLPLPEGTLIDQIQDAETRVIVTVMATSPTSCCPLCLEPSSSIHSLYKRTVADVPCGGPDMFSPIRTNLSKDEAKSSSICDDIRKIIQLSFPEGARTWQVYHRWSVPSNTFWKNARTFWPVRRAVLSDRGNSVELICSKRWSLAG